MVVAVVISLSGAFIDSLRDIPLRIGDMRLDITAIAVKVRNHFPTVLGAAVVESSIPLASAVGPVLITSFGKILAKRLSNPLRCSVLMGLGDYRAARQGEGNRQ